MSADWSLEPLVFRAGRQSFGRETMPSPLQCRTGGMDLADYQRQLREAADDLRRWWNERMHAAFGLMSWPDARIELTGGQIGGPTLRLHGAIRDDEAVLAVQEDDGLGVGSRIEITVLDAEALGGAVVALLPHSRAGSTASLQVPASGPDGLQPGPDDFGMPHSWIEQSYRTTPADRLRKLIEAKRHGDYAVALRPGPDLDLRSGDFGGYFWNWIEPDDGRYLLYHNAKVAGVDPHSPGQMASHLTRLLATTARLYRDSQF
jgi:hypothetical protein